MSAIRAPGLGRGSISALVRLAQTKIKHNFDKLIEDPSPEQEVILISNLIRHLGKPFLTGFSVGINYKVGDLGVLGLALMSSKNAAHAAEIGMRYLNQAFNFTQFNLIQTGDLLTMRWQMNQSYSEEIEQFLIGRDIGIIHFIYRHINFDTDVVRFHKVGLSFDFLAGINEVSKAFGCPVQYNQECTFLTTELIHLNTPPPFSNPANAQIIEDTYFNNLNKFDLTLSQKIKKRLMANADLNVQKSEIADLYYLSERTLARHLNKEGTSWRKLLSEVRIEKATLLLKNSQDSIQQVCDQVGFASISSFCHAFQKAHNVSPSEYRRSNKK